MTTSYDMGSIDILRVCGVAVGLSETQSKQYGRFYIDYAQMEQRDEK